MCHRSWRVALEPHLAERFCERYGTSERTIFKVIHTDAAGSRCVSSRAASLASQALQ